MYGVTLKQVLPHVCSRPVPVQSGSTASVNYSAEQPTWLGDAEVRLLQLRACIPCCLDNMQERCLSCCKLLAAGRCVHCKMYVSDVRAPRQCRYRVAAVSTDAHYL